MKKTILCIFLLSLCIAASARTPELKFDKDGSFKVLQLTDLHLTADNPKAEASTLARIGNMAI